MEWRLDGGGHVALGGLREERDGNKFPELARPFNFSVRVTFAKLTSSMWVSG